ncbi:MAG: DUF1254 domain-containing protein [Beijerinckiaceae bacterium]
MRRRLAIACGASFVAAALVAAGAYIVLLPRALTFGIERKLTACATPTAACAPHGVFIHKRTLASPDDRAVVNPNADTLYSSAWLDLSAGPWVLHAPDMGNRYFSFQLLDAWTDVFGYVSRRTGDGKGGDFLIAGPNWQGLAPPSMKVFRSATNKVWIIGRTLIDGEDDLKDATALQDLFALRKYAGS